MMGANRVLRIAMATGFCVLAVTTALAQPFVDDFEDNSVTDGDPVRWSPFDVPLGYGTIEVTGGNLLLTPSTTDPPISSVIPEIDPNWIELDVYVEERVFQDVSVHLQGQVTGQGAGWLGLYARDQFNLVGAQASSVWGQIGTDTNGTHWVELGGHTGTSFMSPLRQQTSLDFHGADVHLQLNVIGNTASLFAWADGDAKPATPLLSRQLAASQLAAGSVGISYGQFRPPMTQLNTATIRTFEVVPEPSSVVLIVVGLIGIVAARRRAPK